MNFPSEDRGSELRELFFQNAQELLQALNEQALGLENNAADSEAVRSIRRTVHTLKGDAAACGFRQLSELAHELEDVLTPEMAAGNASGLAEVVLSAADMFDAMLAAYKAELEPPNGDPLRAMIWKVAQQASAPKPAGDLQPRFAWSEYEQLSMAEAAGRGLRVYNVAISLAPDCPMRDAGLQVLKKVLQESGTVVAGAAEERLWSATGKLQFALASERDEQWLMAKCRLPGVVAQVVVEKFEVSAGAEEAAEIPTPQPIPLAIPGRDNGGNGGAKPAGLPAAESMLRIEASHIDNLLNLVGELVIGKSMLHQALNEFGRRSPKDPLRAKFADAMAFQSQVLNALQRAAMKIRMVPVEQLFRRFPRLVRDVAKLCGKNVALEISGQETDLDKSLLDAVAEPLAHLLRNAVDHGIESAAERRAAGKPEQGTVRLKAFHQGHEVVIEVSDDGRGIDVHAVLAQAIGRGLISAEQAAHLSEAEAMELIYEPGFSTAGQVTQISGRGMGMDVVRSAVQKLKGGISAESEPGHGTCFRLHLPLTLAIIRAMLFRVAKRLYAVPLDAVQEIARGAEADIHRVENQEVVHLRNEALTLVRLNRARADVASKGKLYVLVISNGERKFGLVVDKLVGEEELVIKPLDDNVVASELVSGASILGDGTVVLILNVSEVVRQFANFQSPRGPFGTGGERAMEARA